MVHQELHDSPLLEPDLSQSYALSHRCRVLHSHYFCHAFSEKCSFFFGGGARSRGFRKLERSPVVLVGSEIPGPLTDLHGFESTANHR